jgi:predicted ATP-grasp superfamily ATP-dependent carboligase
MRPAQELFNVHRDVTFDKQPILLHAFAGFVDAGGGVRITADHLLQNLQHELVATFDSDELIDYRARRPRMSYVRDHFASVDIPTLALHQITDLSGRSFLLLAGPEPDYQWQRFLAAVDLLVDRFDVRLAVGLSAIPWPIPHTRPMGITVHGSDPALLSGFTPVVGEIEVPGHVGAMLELHLGQRGITSMGITAQVPHYLVQFDYPRAATTLLQGIGQVAGLLLPSSGLEPMAAQAEREVAQQLEGNDEFATVVAALEQQYDHLAAVSEGASNELPMADTSLADSAVTGEDIAAQVEQFLASLGDDGRKDDDA